VPQISAIKPQKKKKNRFNIYLDGKFVFGLPAEILVKENLSVGRELSSREINNLIFKNRLGKSLDRVYHFLSYRPRSEREVWDYLKKKEVDRKVAGKVINKLEKLGYIDDLEFTRWWVEQRSIFRPRGKRALMMELWQKGVEQEVIDQVLDELVDETVLAKKAVKKKIVTWQKLPWRERRRKLSDYLARRGFSWEAIKEIVDDSSING